MTLLYDFSYMSQEKQRKIAYETASHFIPYARLFQLYDVAEELE